MDVRDDRSRDDQKDRPPKARRHFLRRSDFFCPGPLPHDAFAEARASGGGFPWLGDPLFCAVLLLSLRFSHSVLPISFFRLTRVLQPHPAVFRIDRSSAEGFFFPGKPDNESQPLVLFYLSQPYSDFVYHL